MAERVTQYGPGHIVMMSGTTREYNKATAYSANEHGRPAHLKVTWTDGHTTEVLWHAIAEVYEDMNYEDSPG